MGNEPREGRPVSSGRATGRAVRLEDEPTLALRDRILRLVEQEPLAADAPRIVMSPEGPLVRPPESVNALGVVAGLGLFAWRGLGGG